MIARNIGDARGENVFVSHKIKPGMEKINDLEKKKLTLDVDLDIALGHWWKTGDVTFGRKTPPHFA